MLDFVYGFYFLIESETLQVIYASGVAQFADMEACQLALEQVKADPNVPFGTEVVGYCAEGKDIQ